MLNGERCDSFKARSLKTVPVGLFGELKIRKRILSVIFAAISLRSG